MSLVLNNHFLEIKIEELNLRVANLIHEKMIMRDVIYELQKRVAELESDGKPDAWKVEELR